jgi:DNA-binding MarR family transcriptional regulator
MMNTDTENPTALNLTIGLNKLSLAIRSQAWKKADTDGLNPTQAQIVNMLGKTDAMQLSQVAQALGISAASVSDSIKTLIEKELVQKHRSTNNARAIALTLTDKGHAQAKLTNTYSDFLISAVHGLTLVEQAVLLKTLTKIIHSLVEGGQISVAKMCLHCTYFRPNVHIDLPNTPHHCQYIDAAFGDSELRLDCADQNTASQEKILENLHAFQ